MRSRLCSSGMRNSAIPLVNAQDDLLKKIKIIYLGETSGVCRNFERGGGEGNNVSENSEQIMLFRHGCVSQAGVCVGKFWLSPAKMTPFGDYFCLNSSTNCSKIRSKYSQF